MRVRATRSLVLDSSFIHPSSFVHGTTTSLDRPPAGSACRGDSGIIYIYIYTSIYSNTAYLVVANPCYTTTSITCKNLLMCVFLNTDPIFPFPYGPMYPMAYLRPPFYPCVRVHFTIHHTEGGKQGGDQQSLNGRTQKTSEQSTHYYPRVRHT